MNRGRLQAITLAALLGPMPPKREALPKVLSLVEALARGRDARAPSDATAPPTAADLMTIARRLPATVPDRPRSEDTGHPREQSWKTLGDFFEKRSEVERCRIALALHELIDNYTTNPG